MIIAKHATKPFSASQSTVVVRGFATDDQLPVQPALVHESKSAYVCLSSAPDHRGILTDLGLPSSSTQFRITHPVIAGVGARMRLRPGSLPSGGKRARSEAWRPDRRSIRATKRGMARIAARGKRGALGRIHAPTPHRGRRCASCCAPLIVAKHAAAPFAAIVSASLGLDNRPA